MLAIVAAILDATRDISLHLHFLRLIPLWLIKIVLLLLSLAKYSIEYTSYCVGFTKVEQRQITRFNYLKQAAWPRK